MLADLARPDVDSLAADTESPERVAIIETAPPLEEDRLECDTGITLDESVAYLDGSSDITVASFLACTQKGLEDMLGESEDETTREFRSVDRLEIVIVGVMVNLDDTRECVESVEVGTKLARHRKCDHISARVRVRLTLARGESFESSKILIADRIDLG